MDYPRDVKILVLLLGFLAACSGKQMKQMRVPNSGYNYNHGHETNSLNKILKAVLVHESTGQGLHSGIVSSSSGNTGVDFKVTKQLSQRTNFGYSYPASQPMKGNVRAADVTTIRVFHESTGNTGNILRDYNPPQKSNANVPRGFSHSAPGMSSPNPAQTLRYIHEKALSRSRSDQSQGQSSSSPIAFPSSPGNAGYKHESSQLPGNADNFYGTPRQAASNSYQNKNSEIVTNTRSASNGYQYSGPVQARNSDMENVRNTKSNSLQAVILSISQAQNTDLRSITTESGQATSNGYQYPNPIEALNGDNDNLRNIGSVSAPTGNENLSNAFTNSNPNQNVNLRNTTSLIGHATSNGYLYPERFEALNTGAGNENMASQIQTFSSSSQPLNVNQRNEEASNGYQYLRQSTIENGRSALNGYQYPAPVLTKNAIAENTVVGTQQTLSHEYQNPRQGINTNLGSSSNGYQYRVPIQDLNVVKENLRHTGGNSPQIAISSLSQTQNVNLRNTAGGSPQVAWNRYQYSSPSQAANRGIGDENLANKISSSSPAQTANLQNTANGPVQVSLNGYQYPNRGLDLNGSNSKSIHNEGLKAENSERATNEGYRYESPISMGTITENQGGAEQIAISQYFSSTLLNSANQGYRYDNPNLSQNSNPQEAYPYTNQVSQRYENPRADGYQYQNQKGQNQFPSPIQLEQPGQPTNTGYRYDGPVHALEVSYNSGQSKNEGYRYDKSEKPASAKSTFKGQPYLPLPPTRKDSGYQYDKPEQSSRPQTTFKGQPYLPLPKQTSRPETTFKGQPYLPLPPVSGGW